MELAFDAKMITYQRRNSLRIHAVRIPIKAITKYGQFDVWSANEIRFNDNNDRPEIYAGVWMPVTDECIALWAAEEKLCWKMPSGRILKPYEPLDGGELPEPREVTAEEVMQFLLKADCVATHQDYGDLRITRHGLDVSMHFVRSRTDFWLEYQTYLDQGMNADTALLRILTNWVRLAMVNHDDAALDQVRPKKRAAKLDSDVRPPLPIESRL